MFCRYDKATIPKPVKTKTDYPILSYGLGRYESLTVSIEIIIIIILSTEILTEL